MKILLLQDEIYLPSLGGGTKANRKLLEALAGMGHECSVIAPAFTKSGDGPSNQLEFMREMMKRQILASAQKPHIFSFAHNGVQVEATNYSDVDYNSSFIARRVAEIDPDWVIVTEDKRRFMLDAALKAAPGKVLLILQTISQLPFGPLSVQESAEQTDLMRRAKAVVVISDYLRRYVREHAGLESHLMRLPVFGTGPFRDLADFDSGYITMVNPCAIKGISIFLALAEKFPQFPFAAVPTWGTTEADIEALKKLPNVRVIEPADDIEEILEQTRLMLVPSLWPETFGYIAVEAMLRGIPVLASKVAGLTEAMLGMDYVLPAIPARFNGEGYEIAPQDTGPWQRSLHKLLTDPDEYELCSRESRQAAMEFVLGADPSTIEGFLCGLSDDGAAVEGGRAEGSLVEASPAGHAGVGGA